MSDKTFKLRHLVTGSLGLWLIAWLLGIVTALSVIGLLMVSGWFITMSAAAGVLATAFSYQTSSTLIRTLAISRTAGRYGELVVAHHAIFDLLKNLRVQFFNAFARLAPSVRKGMSSSDSQYRLVKDIDILNEFTLKFISPIIISISAMLLVFGVISHWQGAWVWGFLLMIMGLFVLSVTFGIKLAQVETTLLQARKTKLQNILPAITQLLIWEQWQAQTKDFEQLDNAVTKFYHSHQKLRQATIIIVAWLMAGLFILVLCVGVNALPSHSDKVTVAFLLAMLFGVLGLSEILMNLVNEPLSYGRSLHAKNRLNELVGQAKITPNVIITDESIALNLNELVTKQPNAIVNLSPATMTVKQGVPMLIRGISGGGKSTLLDTIAGEIVPVSGEMNLKVGDKSYALSEIDWQGGLGYLGQAVDIFDQSLADNLRLGKPNATDDELWHVLEMVALKDWAKAEPQGLATPLGEYGTAVSGGQARRIALARLLLAPKKLLLLDEPFAGLDDTTRQKLWQNLKEHQKDGLLILVTHHEWHEDGTDVTVIG